MNSLLLQTGITLQLNLPLKYLIKRLTFWIQLFKKARDFTTKESLTSAHILNLQRLFNKLYAFLFLQPPQGQKRCHKGRIP